MLNLSAKKRAKIILVFILFLVIISGMALPTVGTTLNASDINAQETPVVSMPSLDASSISMSEASAQRGPPDEEMAVTRWDSDDDSAPTPFTPRTYGPPRIEKVESTSHNSDFVYVLVNDTLWSDLDISSRIYRYEDDVEATGYSVAIYRYLSGSPEFVRSWIDTERDKLILAGDDMIGCLLIGDIPAAWYQMFHDPPWGTTTYEEFPIDLFYMDLDGSWSDTLQPPYPGTAGTDGIYDGHTGNVAPEIWVGRLKADDMVDPEDNLIENYFDKNHDYRTGSLSLPQKALEYVDEDWAGGGGIWDPAIENAYPIKTLIEDASTISTDYVNRLTLGGGWSFVHLMCHGGSARHTFKEPDPTNASNMIWDGRVYGYHPGPLPADEYIYRALDPPVFFYNLFVCSGARFTETDYLAGWCIFTDTYGLAAVGSTKTGSMRAFSGFYTSLGNGFTMGEAFKDWFVTHGESSRPWYYGMAFIGDPTLRVSGKHQMTINTPGLASATGVVHYTEDGVAKTGDISGGSWSELCDHGTTLSIDTIVTKSADERLVTIDPHSWSVAEPRTFTVNYYLQFLMEVSSTGGLLTSTYSGTTEYTSFATSQTGDYWDGATWSDWCDIGSVLTASQIVLGPPNERYHTLDTFSWTVTEPASYVLSYHLEYKVTIMAEGLPDTLSTNVTIGTTNPSPSDDVAGGDVNDYVLTLDSSNIPPFTWTNWVHPDTDMTALSLITVSANEKFILICWTRNGLRFGPPTVYAEVAGSTYSAQYAGMKKEMSLNDANLCDPIIVTIEISNPPTGTGSDNVEVVDDLPNELSFVIGSAEIDGAPYNPTVAVVDTPEKHQQLTFTVDGSGKHTITFEVKVNRAYATDQTIENKVGVTFDFETVPVAEIDVSFYVTIHPYEGPSLSKSTDGHEIVPLFTRESWVFTYIVKNNYGYAMADPVMKDNFGAELEYDLNTVIANLLSTPEFSESHGKSQQIRLVWTLPDLTVGEAFMLQVTMNTGTNPSNQAQQLYTTPGAKVLNSGAVLKWLDDLDVQQSLETETISVTAVGQIYGYVRDQDSAGVKGAIVELYYDGELVATAQTDSSGQYNFAQELTDSGVYTIKITELPKRYDFGIDPSEKTATYTVGQLDPTEVNFEVQRIKGKK